ncbi:MAG: hypothetical protein NTY99_01775 [DPANN group archaeon]|nr:hypothetical protein [DPANN group archaeon]
MTFRAATYGQVLADWVGYTIQTIPETEREAYRSKLIEELRKYSFEPRKKGSPKNSGCTCELETIVESFDMKNPEHVAKLIKEGIHLMYQKGTAKRVLESLLASLV